MRDFFRIAVEIRYECWVLGCALSHTLQTGIVFRTLSLHYYSAELSPGIHTQFALGARGVDKWRLRRWSPMGTSVRGKWVGNLTRREDTMTSKRSER